MTIMVRPWCALLVPQMRFSGVIWSGFETPEAVVHGLWAHSLTWHLDLMRELGFNMIRLPFAGAVPSYNGHVGGIHDIYPLNPELKVQYNSVL